MFHICQQLIGNIPITYRVFKPRWKKHRECMCPELFENISVWMPTRLFPWHSIHNLAFPRRISRKMLDMYSTIVHKYEDIRCSALISIDVYVSFFIPLFSQAYTQEILSTLDTTCWFFRQLGTSMKGIITPTNSKNAVLFPNLFSSKSRMSSIITLFQRCLAAKLISPSSLKPIQATPGPAHSGTKPALGHGRWGGELQNIAVLSF